MSAKTGQVVTPLFTTANPVIGSAINADATPVGTLYLNGTANAATVTVTNIDAGRYKAAVTMPTLAAGDRVSLSVAATVNGVTGKGIIWGDMGETATASDVKTVADAIAAKTTNLPASPAAVGAAMTLTTGERTSVATAVWAATTRTLSGFGTLVADVWASATRGLTDKAGYSGTATNMVAAAPLATVNADAVRTNLTTELARIDENVSAAKTLTSGERTSIAGAVSGFAATGLAALKALLDAVKLKSDNLPDNTTNALANIASAIGAVIPGATPWTYTLTQPGGAPIADAEVWVTSDAAGDNVVASGRTDAFGVVTFYLDAGTYYVWAQKSGTNFDNPDEVTVTA